MDISLRYLQKSVLIDGSHQDGSNLFMSVILPQVIFKIFFQDYSDFLLQQAYLI